MNTRHLLTSLLALALAAAPATAAKRVALVIGNATYADGMALKTPVNDARAVAASLRALGFDVVAGENVNLDGMEKLLRQFRQKIEPGDFAWFYYAGHGVQADNVNYLVPVGEKVGEAYELKRKTLDLDTVKAALDESKARLKVLVLDCCRDNPMPRSWTRSIGTRGLAPAANLPEGTIVAYSTAPNTVALDVDATNLQAANSPYTTQLTTALNKRPPGGLDLKTVFFDVAAAVKEATGQRPHLDLDATLGTYHLDRSTTEAVAAAASAPPVAPPAPGTAQFAPPPPAPLVPASPVAAMPPTVPGSAPVANTIATVFANGPYATYNNTSRVTILKQVQGKLKAANCYHGGIDGGFGPGTQAGIVQWQQTNGLPATGLLDQATLQSMSLLGLAEVPESRSSGSSGRKSSPTRESSPPKWYEYIPRNGPRPPGPRFPF